MGSLEEVDLAYLRDFLSTLQSMGVASFSGCGICVSFSGQNHNVGFVPGYVPAAKGLEFGNPEPARAPAPQVDRDGWRNPNLWPQQGGKILKLDGSLE